MSGSSRKSFRTAREAAKRAAKPANAQYPGRPSSETRLSASRILRMPCSQLVMRGSQSNLVLWVDVEQRVGLARSLRANGSVSEVDADDAVVAGASLAVVLVVQVVVVDDEAVEQPLSSPAVGVELFADQDVVEGFAEVLVDVGVVHVAGVSVLLESLGGVEANVGAALGVADEVAGLFGEDVGGVAVLSVVDVA